MSVRRRLERLEANAAAPPGSDFPRKNLEWYFAALEHARGEGSAPRPQPYTEEDYREDVRVIGWLRADPGWDTEEGHRFLDEWERANKEGLMRGERA